MGRRAICAAGRREGRSGAWRADPVLLLGARENLASLELEPHCELPSWVRFEGKPIFGGLICFGQKGSGKTSLLKRMIDDALGFRAHDDAHKPALMALDPKGDLSAYIVEIAAREGRGADVVRLSVGGAVRWNPFGHLGPATPAREIRQAGYFLRCAMPQMSGDAAYWEDNATNLLSYSMQLLAYAGELVSFESLAQFVVRLKGATGPNDHVDDEMAFREGLYAQAKRQLERLDLDGSQGLLEELVAVRVYFEEEFVFLDAKPRSIVVNTATNFLRKFEGAEYRRTFGGRAREPDQFAGFADLVDRGRIFVLDVRAVEDGQISAALCCLAKLFCQAAILTRDRRDPEMRRVVVNVLDEYQQYVTLGGSGSQGDPEYLETSRSFRAVDVAATQQMSSIQAAAGGHREAAQRVVGSFNSLILFRHNDAALTQYAGHLMGKRDRTERSWSVSEGGQDTKRLRLLPGAQAADKQSVNRSVQERTVQRDVLADEVFASLQVFEAVGIFNTPDAGRAAVRFCCKPNWLPARTPQTQVLERVACLEPGRADRLGRWTALARWLRVEWTLLWRVKW